MSEYIKRELAVSAIALETDLSLEQARKIIGNVPCIDVTRCEECKYSIEVKDSNSIICKHPSQHATYERTSDHYCSYGERKDEKDG